MITVKPINQLDLNIIYMVMEYIDGNSVIDIHL